MKNTPNTQQAAHTPGPVQNRAFVRPHTITGLFEIADSVGNTFGNSRDRWELELQALALNFGRNGARRLIAAAPDLLAACEIALKNAEGRLHRMPAVPATRDEETARIAQECECGILRAAIARAKGVRP